MRRKISRKHTSDYLDAFISSSEINIQYIDLSDLLDKRITPEEKKTHMLNSLKVGRRIFW